MGAPPHSMPMARPVRRIETDTPKAELAFCLLTAASASLPIAISPKQSGHYAFPSYSLYALALAIWCVPAVIELFGSAADRSLRGGAAEPRPSAAARLGDRRGGMRVDRHVLSCGPAASRQGHVSRHAGRRPISCRGKATIGSTAELVRRLSDPDVSGPLGRHRGRISASATNSRRICRILPCAAIDAAPPAGYTPIAADLRRYRLFERSPTAPQRVGLGDTPSRQ